MANLPSQKEGSSGWAPSSHRQWWWSLAGMVLAYSQCFLCHWDLVPITLAVNYRLSPLGVAVFLCSNLTCCLLYFPPLNIICSVCRLSALQPPSPPLHCLLPGKSHYSHLVGTKPCLKKLRCVMCSLSSCCADLSCTAWGRHGCLLSALHCGTCTGFSHRRVGLKERLGAGFWHSI